MTWPLLCNIVSAIQERCTLHCETTVVNYVLTGESAEYIDKVFTFS